MDDQGSLVTTLARALAADWSQESHREAIAAIRHEQGVSYTRAYALLVRAAATLPPEQVEQPAMPLLQPRLAS